MGALETNTTLIYGIHVRESADDGSDFTNAAADYRILFLGEDGLLHVKDSSGTVTEPFTPGSGSGQGLVDFASAKRTAGDVTCSADQVWTDVDTGIDLTMTATSGDWLEVGVSIQTFDTAAVSLFFTAMTIVSASPVNDIATNTSPSNTTNGIGAWTMTPSTVNKAAGSILYQTVSGDISGGNVVLRLRYRTSNNTNRVIEAAAGEPIHFWAKNIGPSI